jgi:hypothetical protein
MNNQCPICGQQGWFYDRGRVRLYCHEHAPADTIDLFPRFVADLLRAPDLAAEMLRDPNHRAFTVDVRAEVERRLAAGEDDGTG